MSCIDGDWPRVEKLLREGADARKGEQKEKKIGVHFHNKFLKDNLSLHALHFAALHSDFMEQNLVDLFLKRGMERDDLIEVGYFSGNRKMIEYRPIKYSFEWESALCAACQGNQVELVEEIIQNCKGHQLSWDLGLYYACAGAAKEAIHLMIEKGATDFNMALDPACKKLLIHFLMTNFIFLLER